jgi:hypothetical protein
MKTIIQYAIFLSILFASAQPEIEWQKNYGGSDYDNSFSIIQTNDGGYAITGYILSHDGDVSGQNNDQQHIWVVKLNAQGVIEWEKGFGGTGYDRAYSIQQTSDNGFIVGGLTASDDGDITEYFGYEDIWVLKLDSSGNLEWQKSYGDDDNEQIWEILQTTDGGYVMAGNSWINTSHSDFIVNKIYPNGDLEWQQIFGYNNDSEDYARSIKQTTDGGYIVAGRTTVLENQLNTSDYWVVKLNAQGVIEWDSRLGGSNIDEAWEVLQTTDGGYVVTGYSYSNDGDVTGNHGMEDVWVVKLSASGSVQWQKSIGGSTHDRSYSIIQNSDGDFIISGYTDSVDGDITHYFGGYDGWIIKLDSIGNFVWQISIGGSSSDVFRRVIQTTDGSYAVSGGINSSDTQAGTLNGGLDFWVVKLQAETLGVSQNYIDEIISIYPNPSKNKIYIKTDLNVIDFTLYDAIGKLIINQKTNKVINVEQLTKGIYILKINTDKGLFTKNIIIN